MADKKFSPVFTEYLGIAEVLRDSVDKINEVFTDAIEEVEKLWREIK